MIQKPDYEALKQRVDELEKESLDRKLAEKKMLANEERCRTLFENSRDAIVITTREGEIVDINEAALGLFGYTGEEIMGVSFREFYVRPEDGQRFQQALEQKGSVLDYEVDLLKKDGTKINCLLSVTVRLAGNGAVLEYQGIIRDISHRKRSEHAILQSKEHYQTLVEESFDGVFVQKGARIIFANRRLHEMLGYDEGELLGLDHWLVYHPDYQELTRGRAEARMKGEAVPSHYEVRMLRKDGSCFYVDINARAIGFGGEPGIQVWIKDITEHRQAEKALRDSEQRYRSVFENTGAATVIIEEDEIISMMNTEFEKLSGYSQDEVVGKKRWTDFVLSEDLEKTKKSQTIRIKNGGKASTEYEFGFVDKQGNIKDTISTVGMIPGTKKRVASLMDVTFRRQAEEAVRQSEQRYRFLVENVLLGLFICEMPSGRFLFLNEKISEIFGYGVEEGLSMSIWDVVSPDEHNVLRRRIDGKIKGELPPSDSVIYTAIKKDGSNFRAEVNATPVTYQGISAMQGVVMDVTEKELLEKQLQQAQKMEAIGTLAGGIAHDFNNLLMAIQGNTSLMLLGVDSSHSHYEKLINIEQYVRRGADLTKQLLGFARGGKYEVRPTDLNELMMMSSEMFARTKKEIVIQSKYQQDLWTVEVDQGQIEQVLLNLYVNAWQAMPGG
ncbi:MAG: PAS domain S-box protein, partial [Desulfobacterales bacterium]|nr:PAS domain S-box protein [Desulfobacterales bacterium]